MTQRASFWRKVAYIAAMVVLLVPLSMLSMPAARGVGGGQAGGMLARMRTEHKLGQANLGEIDPASETIKLVTLGLRPVAVNVLWQKAAHAKKVEDWTTFQATLEQIARLQPNFISVWQFQAWNLSYNLSVEFDDYRDRYRWVIRGIDYLTDGLKYNVDEPRLLWDKGWFIGQKIGRADERVQYRRLYKEDYNEDNWLVAKRWFQRAVDVDMYTDKRMKGKGQMIFRSDPAMSQMNYADALQDDDVHGTEVEQAWRQAERDWTDYGNMDILSSYGIRVHLNDKEAMEADAVRYMSELEALLPEARKVLQVQKIQGLTEEERALLETDPEDVPIEKQQRYFGLQRHAEVSAQDLAEYISENKSQFAKKASRLLHQWQQANQRAEIIDRYRGIVNYDFWRDRPRFEQEPDTLLARELITDARAAYENTDFPEAKALYEQSWPLWRRSLDKYEVIRDDGTLPEELVDEMWRYRRVLDALDVPFPQDFILRDIAKDWDRDGKLADVWVTTEKPASENAETGEKEKPATKEAAKEKVESPTPKETKTLEEGTPPDPEFD